MVCYHFSVAQALSTCPSSVAESLRPCRKMALFQRRRRSWPDYFGLRVSRHPTACSTLRRLRFPLARLIRSIQHPGRAAFTTQRRASSQNSITVRCYGHRVAAVLPPPVPKNYAASPCSVVICLMIIIMIKSLINSANRTNQPSYTRRGAYRVLVDSSRDP